MKHAFCAVAILSGGAVQATPPLESGRHYVEGIYRAIPRAGFDWRAIRYAPALEGLMRRDAAFSSRSGDVGALDWVPFCECQDNDDNYAIVGSRASRIGSAGARIAVSLRNGPVRRFAIDLLWNGRHWSVADIHGPRTPSLLAYLRREMPKAEATLRRPS